MVCPSGINGLVGIKPTVGLVSRSGIIPISASQDTAGPMALSVADAAALLTVMAGPDPKDPATTVQTRPAVLDYSKFLKTDGLHGARLGVARNLGGFDGRIDKVMDLAIAAMRAQGAEIVDPTDLKTDPQAGRLGADATEVRVQGWSQQVPGDAHRRAEDARRSHRIQRKGSGARDAVFRPGDLHRLTGQGSAVRRANATRPQRRRKSPRVAMASTPYCARTSSTR